MLHPGGLRPPRHSGRPRARAPKLYGTLGSIAADVRSRSAGRRSSRPGATGLASAARSASQRASRSSLPWTVTVLNGAGRDGRARQRYRAHGRLDVGARAGAPPGSLPLPDRGRGRPSARLPGRSPACRRSRSTSLSTNRATVTPNGDGDRDSLSIRVGVTRARDARRDARERVRRDGRDALHRAGREHRDEHRHVVERQGGERDDRPRRPVHARRAGDVGRRALRPAGRRSPSTGRSRARPSRRASSRRTATVAASRSRSGSPFPARPRRAWASTRATGLWPRRSPGRSRPGARP